MLRCSAPSTPCTPPTPTTPFSPLHTPATPCSAISRSSSQQNVDTDSGKSSCSPALLDCSFDSGICVEINDMELKCKLKDYKRILQVLEKDRAVYRLLRERLSKIVERKTKKPLKEEISCNVCCAEIDAEKPKSYVTCSVCEKTVCRDIKCSDWLPDSAQWECHTCHSSKQSLAHTSSWVAEQLSFNQHKFVYPMRARSEIYIPINADPNDSSMHFESVSQLGGFASTTALGGAGALISNEQKLKIREYVEEVVAQMLGGSLDSVAVGQISKSESYLLLFRKYHSKLSNLLINMENALLASMHKRDLPALINGHQPPNNTAAVGRSSDFTDLSQTRLRQLIETIIAETLRLPLALSSGAVSEVAFDTHSNGGNALTLANGDARRHRTEHYFEPKIYQDLLATAVLNKIADSHGNAAHLSESSPQFNSTDANQNFQENQSTSSGSSIEPRSDCSFTDTDQIINLSKGEDYSPCGSDSNLNADVIAKLQLDAGRESALSNYIAAHMVPLPDLSTPVTESEEDDYVSVTSSQMGDGNWEDNWLFKKKKSTLKASVSTSSIGMLVPAPKEDVRAQIGDKIADEISDLSEMGSDTDDSSLDLLRGQLDPLNNRLLNKHLIGGQNTKLVLDELIDRSSMISATSPAEHEPIYTETKNKHVINPTTNKEAINTTVTNSLLQSSPPTSTDTITDASDPVILPPPCHFDDTKNGEATLEIEAAVPITAPINIIEDIEAAEGCLGISTEVEVYDSDPDENLSEPYGAARVPSVIEILAAIALGPMLAVPASEQQTVLTPTEMASLKELSDLALAEIKARDPSSTYKMLGVIDEESVEDDVNKNLTEPEELIETTQEDPELTTSEHAMDFATTTSEMTDSALKGTELKVASLSSIESDGTVRKDIQSSLLDPAELKDLDQTKMISDMKPPNVALTYSESQPPMEKPSEQLIIEIYPSIEPIEKIPTRQILPTIDSGIIPATIIECEEEAQTETPELIESGPSQNCEDAMEQVEETKDPCKPETTENTLPTLQTVENIDTTSDPNVDSNIAGNNVNISASNALEIVELPSPAIDSEGPEAHQKLEPTVEIKLDGSEPQIIEKELSPIETVRTEPETIQPELVPPIETDMKQEYDEKHSAVTATATDVSKAEVILVEVVDSTNLVQTATQATLLDSDETAIIETQFPAEEAYVTVPEEIDVVETVGTKSLLTVEQLVDDGEMTVIETVKPAAVIEPLKKELEVGPNSVDPMETASTELQSTIKTAVAEHQTTQPEIISTLTVESVESISTEPILAVPIVEAESEPAKPELPANQSKLTPPEISETVDTCGSKESESNPEKLYVEPEAINETYIDQPENVPLPIVDTVETTLKESECSVKEIPDDSLQKALLHMEHTTQVLSPQVVDSVDTAILESQSIGQQTSFELEATNEPLTSVDDSVNSVSKQPQSTLEPIATANEFPLIEPQLSVQTVVTDGTLPVIENLEPTSTNEQPINPTKVIETSVVDAIVKPTTEPTLTDETVFADIKPPIMKIGPLVLETVTTTRLPEDQPEDVSNPLKDSTQSLSKESQLTLEPSSVEVTSSPVEEPTEPTIVEIAENIETPTAQTEVITSPIVAASDPPMLEPTAIIESKTEKPKVLQPPVVDSIDQLVTETAITTETTTKQPEIIPLPVVEPSDLSLIEPQEITEPEKIEPDIVPSTNVELSDKPTIEPKAITELPIMEPAIISTPVGDLIDQQVIESAVTTELQTIQPEVIPPPVVEPTVELVIEPSVKAEPETTPPKLSDLSVELPKAIHEQETIQLEVIPQPIDIPSDKPVIESSTTTAPETVQPETVQPETTLPPSTIEPFIESITEPVEKTETEIMHLKTIPPPVDEPSDQSVLIPEPTLEPETMQLKESAPTTEPETKQSEMIPKPVVDISDQLTIETPNTELTTIQPIATLPQVVESEQQLVETVTSTEPQTTQVEILPPDVRESVNQPVTEATEKTEPSKSEPQFMSPQMLETSQPTVLEPAATTEPETTKPNVVSSPTVELSDQPMVQFAETKLHEVTQPEVLAPAVAELSDSPAIESTTATSESQTIQPEVILPPVVELSNPSVVEPTGTTEPEMVEPKAVSSTIVELTDQPEIIPAVINEPIKIQTEDKPLSVDGPSDQLTAKTEHETIQTEIIPPAVVVPSDQTEIEVAATSEPETIQANVVQSPDVEQQCQEVTEPAATIEPLAVETSEQPVTELAGTSEIETIEPIVLLDPAVEQSDQVVDETATAIISPVVELIDPPVIEPSDQPANETTIQPDVILPPITEPSNSLVKEAATTTTEPEIKLEVVLLPVVEPPDQPVILSAANEQESVQPEVIPPLVVELSDSPAIQSKAATCEPQQIQPEIIPASDAEPTNQPVVETPATAESEIVQPKILQPTAVEPIHQNIKVVGAPTNQSIFEPVAECESVAIKSDVIPSSDVESSNQMVAEPSSTAAYQPAIRLPPTEPEPIQPKMASPQVVEQSHQNQVLETIPTTEPQTMQIEVIPTKLSESIHQPVIKPPSITESYAKQTDDVVSAVVKPSEPAVIEPGAVTEPGTMQDEIIAPTVVESVDELEKITEVTTEAKSLQPEMKPQQVDKATVKTELETIQPQTIPLQVVEPSDQQVREQKPHAEQNTQELASISPRVLEPSDQPVIEPVTIPEPESIQPDATPPPNGEAIDQPVKETLETLEPQATQPKEIPPEIVEQSDKQSIETDGIPTQVIGLSNQSMINPEVTAEPSAILPQGLSTQTAPPSDQQEIEPKTTTKSETKQAEPTPLQGIEPSDLSVIETETTNEIVEPSKQPEIETASTTETKTIQLEAEVIPPGVIESIDVPVMEHTAATEPETKQTEILQPSVIDTSAPAAETEPEAEEPVIIPASYVESLVKPEHVATTEPSTNQPEAVSPSTIEPSDELVIEPATTTEPQTIKTEDLQTTVSKPLNESMIANALTNRTEMYQPEVEIKPTPFIESVDTPVIKETTKTELKTIQSIHVPFPVAELFDKQTTELEEKQIDDMPHLVVGPTDLLLIEPPAKLELPALPLPEVKPVIELVIEPATPTEVLSPLIVEPTKELVIEPAVKTEPEGIKSEVLSPPDAVAANPPEMELPSMESMAPPVKEPVLATEPQTIQKDIKLLLVIEPIDQEETDSVKELKQETAELEIKPPPTTELSNIPARETAETSEPHATLPNIIAPQVKSDQPLTELETKASEVISDQPVTEHEPEATVSEVIPSPIAELSNPSVKETAESSAIQPEVIPPQVRSDQPVSEPELEITASEVIPPPVAELSDPPAIKTADTSESQEIFLEVIPRQVQSDQPVTEPEQETTEAEVVATPVAQLSNPLAMGTVETSEPQATLSEVISPQIKSDKPVTEPEPETTESEVIPHPVAELSDAPANESAETSAALTILPVVIPPPVAEVSEPPAIKTAETSQTQGILPEVTPPPVDKLSDPPAIETAETSAAQIVQPEVIPPQVKSDQPVAEPEQETTKSEVVPHPVAELSDAPAIETAEISEPQVIQSEVIPPEVKPDQQVIEKEPETTEPVVIPHPVAQLSDEPWIETAETSAAQIVQPEVIPPQVKSDQPVAEPEQETTESEVIPPPVAELSDPPTIETAKISEPQVIQPEVIPSDVKPDQQVLGSEPETTESAVIPPLVQTEQPEVIPAQVKSDQPFAVPEQKTTEAEVVPLPLAELSDPPAMETAEISEPQVIQPEVIPPEMKPDQQVLETEPETTESTLIPPPVPQLSDASAIETTETPEQRTILSDVMLQQSDQPVAESVPEKPESEVKTPQVAELSDPPVIETAEISPIVEPEPETPESEIKPPPVAKLSDLLMIETAEISITQTTIPVFTLPPFAEVSEPPVLETVESSVAQTLQPEVSPPPVVEPKSTESEVTPPPVSELSDPPAVETVSTSEPQGILPEVLQPQAESDQQVTEPEPETRKSEVVPTPVAELSDTPAIETAEISPIVEPEPETTECEVIPRPLAELSGPLALEITETCELQAIHPEVIALPVSELSDPPAIENAEISEPQAELPEVIPPQAKSDQLITEVIPSPADEPSDPPAIETATASEAHKIQPEVTPTQVAEQSDLPAIEPLASSQPQVIQPEVMEVQVISEQPVTERTESEGIPHPAAELSDISVIETAVKSEPQAIHSEVISPPVAELSDQPAIENAEISEPQTIVSEAIPPQVKLDQPVAETTASAVIASEPQTIQPEVTPPPVAELTDPPEVKSDQPVTEPKPEKPESDLQPEIIPPPLAKALLPEVIPLQVKSDQLVTEPEPALQTAETSADPPAIETLETSEPQAMLPQVLQQVKSDQPVTEPQPETIESAVIPPRVAQLSDAPAIETAETSEPQGILPGVIAPQVKSDQPVAEPEPESEVKPPPVAELSDPPVIETADISDPQAILSEVIPSQVKSDQLVTEPEPAIQTAEPSAAQTMQPEVIPPLVVELSDPPAIKTTETSEPQAILPEVILHQVTSDQLVTEHGQETTESEVILTPVGEVTDPPAIETAEISEPHTILTEITPPEVKSDQPVTEPKPEKAESEVISLAVADLADPPVIETAEPSQPHAITPEIIPPVTNLSDTHAIETAEISTVQTIQPEVIPPPVAEQSDPLVNEDAETSQAQVKQLEVLPPQVKSDQLVTEPEQETTESVVILPSVAELSDSPTTETAETSVAQTTQPEFILTPVSELSDPTAIQTSETSEPQTIQPEFIPPQVKSDQLVTEPEPAIQTAETSAAQTIQPELTPETAAKSVVQTIELKVKLRHVDELSDQLMTDNAVTTESDSTKADVIPSQIDESTDQVVIETEFIKEQGAVQNEVAPSTVVESSTHSITEALATTDAETIPSSFQPSSETSGPQAIIPEVIPPQVKSDQPVAEPEPESEVKPPPVAELSDQLVIETSVKSEPQSIQPEVKEPSVVESINQAIIETTETTELQTKVTPLPVIESTDLPVLEPTSAIESEATQLEVISASVLEPQHQTEKEPVCTTEPLTIQPEVIVPPIIESKDHSMTEVVATIVAQAMPYEIIPNEPQTVPAEVKPLPVVEATCETVIQSSVTIEPQTIQPDIVPPPVIESLGKPVTECTATTKPQTDLIENASTIEAQATKPEIISSSIAEPSDVMVEEITTETEITTIASDVIPSSILEPLNQPVMESEVSTEPEAKQPDILPSPFIASIDETVIEPAAITEPKTIQPLDKPSALVESIDQSTKAEVLAIFGFPVIGTDLKVMDQPQNFQLECTASAKALNLEPQTILEPNLDTPGQIINRELLNMNNTSDSATISAAIPSPAFDSLEMTEIETLPVVDEIDFSSTSQLKMEPEIQTEEKTQESTTTETEVLPTPIIDAVEPQPKITVESVEPSFEPSSSVTDEPKDGDQETKNETAQTTPGNPSRRGLIRQHNVTDTTPSEEAHSKSVSLLATICKCYIKDKRLVAALEKRRQQTLLIQRYLNSFDLPESEEAECQSLIPEQTFIMSSTPELGKNENETEKFVVGDLNHFTFNFINNILFSDQLSSDSNNTDESVMTTVENFAEERAPKLLKLSAAQSDEISSSSITLAPVHLTNNHCCSKNAHNTTKSTTTTTTTTNSTNTYTSTYVITNGSIAGDHKSTACSEKPLSPADEEEALEHVDDDLIVLRRFVPGSIAEREYKKWYNAVDMPNNPYAPDALKRRISGSQERFMDLPNISPSTEQNPITLLGNTSTATANEESEQNQERDYKRYSRDYYINDIKVQVDTSKKPTTLSTAATNSQESVDITINEAEIANKTATTTPSEHIYQALPAQVVEDPASLETQSTLSNQSIQSVNTTTSDESDTIRIYDFNKQETTVIRESNIAAMPKLSTASTQSTSLESNKDAPPHGVSTNNKERPTDLAIASTSAAVTSPPPFTPSRGSTPTAFKFLQPKRKLIDPSQVLSFDEEDVPPAAPVERKPIEDEVAHVLPSVKALAQAFLMTSHKHPQVVGTRRWPMKLKKLTPEPPKITPTPVQPKLLEASPSFIEVGEDATIASDLSSLETDPSMQQEALECDANADPNAAGTSPVPVRAGFLRSNIAFFENLKFK